MRQQAEVDLRREQLEAMKQAIADVASGSIGGISGIAMNLKAWEADRDCTIDTFMQSSNNAVIKALLASTRNSACVQPPIRYNCEALGTLEGSGCAIIATLRACRPPISSALP
jgi:hypothetical protein